MSSASETVESLFVHTYSRQGRTHVLRVHLDKLREVSWDAGTLAALPVVRLTMNDGTVVKLKTPNGLDMPEAKGFEEMLETLLIRWRTRQCQQGELKC